MAYLAHPVLGPRLVTCVEALRAHRGTPVQHILGDLDALKLRSSLTLFARAHGGDGGAFAVALDDVCGGVRDADGGPPHGWVTGVRKAVPAGEARASVFTDPLHMTTAPADT